MRLEVETYSGYKADERPLRFVLDGRRYEVERVLQQWYGPEGTYFRVRAGDGKVYLLFRAGDGAWSLRYC